MRLFVAMDIPENVRASIGALVTKLRASYRDARWVRIEGLHLTLKFIGEIPLEITGAIKDSLEAVPSRAPIAINFRGVGFFPNERHPRVLWAGIEAGPELGALAAAIERTLDPLGISRDERSFSPHLTLARLESTRKLDALHAAIEKAGSLEFGAATIESFHLYQSVLKPGGAEYTRRATFSFTGSEPK